MPATSNNWVAKLFPMEWGYIASKSSGPRDLKSWAIAFYRVEQEKRIDDKVKLDIAKFFNPVKPLNLGMRFIMNKIQDYVDYNLLRENDHDYIGTPVNKDFSASTIPQRLLKGVLLSPLLIISAPLRLLDKVVDGIISPIVIAEKTIINTNKTFRQSLKTEDISHLFKNSYVARYNHVTKTIDTIDPLRVVNPARPLNFALAILTIQTAALIDNWLPGQNPGSSMPARIVKGLVVTPLILIRTPIAILDNVIDALLSPLKPLLELTSSSYKDSFSDKNASASPSPTAVATPKPSKTSFISTAAHLVQMRIASFKPDFSEHGLTKTDYKQLKKDHANKMDLKNLRQLHRDYKKLVEKMGAGEVISKGELEDLDNKKNKIISLIEKLKTKLPASTPSPTTSTASTSTPTPSVTSVDANNPQQLRNSDHPSMGA